MTTHAPHAAPAAATLPRLQAGAPYADALGRFQAHGALVIENALAPAQLARLVGELAPWFDRAHCGAGPFFGRQTRRFGGLFAKSRAVGGLAIDPLVLAIVEGALQRPQTQDAVELNLTQAIGIEPGEPGQFLHRDDELWPFARDYEVMVNALWTIDPFTVENGATRLIPGSHRWPRERAPEPGEAVAAVAPAGSVVLWTGGLLHGGGANRSQAIRRGLVMSYRLGWLASGERLLLSTPPEVARRLPEQLQRLLGYQLHRPNLGWIEGQDPIRWLRGETGPLAVTQDNLAPAHEALLADVAARPEAYQGYLG
jgi:ectoine hydroxylase-related dioxygenase (phytanoyl-CoA dioxygenase family)